MLSNKTLDSIGVPTATVYDFENAGDTLPKHTHSEETNHITIVCRGRIKVFSHDWEIVASAGDILNFKPFEPHEFEALEPNTRIVGIAKNQSR